MKSKLFLSILPALVILSAPAMAMEHGDGPKDGPGKGEQRFIETDTDKDGFISKDEMMAAHQKRVDEMFSKTDTDGDGKLSREEMKAGRDKMREKMKEKFKEHREKRQGGEGKDLPEEGNDE